MKFYYITNVTDPNTSGNETTFWNFHGNAICFFFSQRNKYYSLTFDDTFKMYCCELCYRNSCSLNKPHLRVVEYATSFLFFNFFLIYVYFKEAVVKIFMKKWSFFNTNGGTLNIRQNLKKGLLFRSKIGIFEISFKRLYEENFEDLQINRNWKFQTRPTMSHKMAALQSFCKITQKSSFNS